MNLEAAVDVGIDAERIVGVLTAIAPIIGAPRVVSATGKIAAALAVDIESMFEG
jgi:4-carboxymuconolactone decarboxylase